MRSKAYSYIRFSTKEQSGGDSLRRQLELSRTYAREHDLDLDEGLRDIGVSAFRGKNRDEGALSRFLDLARTGQVEKGSYLLVESLDRLSRDQLLEAIPPFIEIIKAGVTIVTLADQAVYSRASIEHDWSKLLVSLTYMARAHEESAIKSKRLAAVWKNKKVHARERRVSAICPGWLRPATDGKGFEPIPERVRVVHRIADESISGLGKRKIAERLNRDGIPAFRGKSGWHASSVQKILDNDAVLGIYHPHKREGGKRVPDGEPVTSYYPAIMDERKFWRARSSKEARRVGSGGRKGRGVANLLSGIGSCGCCGSRMVFIDKGAPPKGGKYLVCGSAKRGLCANRQHYRYEPLEMNVLYLVSEIDLNAINGVPGNDNGPGGELEQIKAEIARKEAALDCLVDNFARGAVPAVEKRIHSLNVELETLKVESGKLELRVRAEQVSPAASRWDELCDAVAKLALAGEDEQYLLRSRLAASFKAAVQTMEFHEEGRVIVVTGTEGPRRVSYVFLTGRFHRAYVEGGGSFDANDLRRLYKRQTGRFSLAPVA